MQCITSDLGHGPSVHRNFWLPKGRGRPSVCEDVVELILDMKRSNWAWGALRISQELLWLAIHVHKKTVNRILLENGILSIVDLQTRQLVAINATLNPDRHWITQQICNVEMSGYKLPSWCNGICERFHRSLKSEVLNRVGPLDVAGIRRLSICYQEYFNGRRPHQGINGKTPTKVIQLESRQTLIPAIR